MVEDNLEKIDREVIQDNINKSSQCVMEVFDEPLVAVNIDSSN